MGTADQGGGTDGGEAAADPFVPQLYDPETHEGLKHSMSWWLIGIGRLWRNLIDDQLKSTQQSQPRWRVLAWARILPGIRQADLAERMDLARPTLVRLLDNLEEQALIQRRTKAADRRENGIHLTDKATPIVRAIEQEVRRINDILLQDVSDEEMRICLDVLRRIRIRCAEISQNTTGFPPPPR
jgi:MarR family transcriptional regulator for hemolysin